ncbi:hypothetical protein RvY_11016-2 [Ramazzottius varieornatus]|uniref:Uncharacterized protein n=1 Tax=Ramazzottius varieornatus TaxID=947166 RepID=A0A1D1VMJ0_RAMVA|nr:hypothetical protein RvY_11016-2 [Ramazzottius varieornatus]
MILSVEFLNRSSAVLAAYWTSRSTPYQFQHPPPNSSHTLLHFTEMLFTAVVLVNFHRIHNGFLHDKEGGLNGTEIIHFTVLINDGFQRKLRLDVLLFGVTSRFLDQAIGKRQQRWLLGLQRPRRIAHRHGWWSCKVDLSWRWGCTSISGIDGRNHSGSRQCRRQRWCEGHHKSGR